MEAGTLATREHPLAEDSGGTLCALCQTPVDYRFNLLVLGRHSVSYFQCSKCDAIQTEHPYWFDEAPWPAIAALDTGAVQRTRVCADLTLALCFLLDIDCRASCLDFGGGSGLFVRMMRDAGLNFLWYDKYAANVFASGFHGDIRTQHRLLTCFEVFEHLPDAEQQIHALFAHRHDYILVSTVLHNNQGPGWWYYCPEAGGHVIFYSARTMAQIGQRYGYEVVSGPELTLFVRDNTLSPRRRRLVERVIRKSRLTKLLLTLRPRFLSRISSDFTCLRDEFVRHQAMSSASIRPEVRSNHTDTPLPLSWKRRTARAAVEWLAYCLELAPVRAARRMIGTARELADTAHEAPAAARRFCRMLTLRTLGRADYARWSDLTNFEEWWRPRTELAARLIPSGAKVCEFGAGKRALERYLDSSTSYVPSDIADRGPGTYVCDLNKRPLPELGHLNTDTAVFIGVLEYLRDLPEIARWLSREFNSCVASYDGVDSKRWSLRRIVEFGRRRYFGYMNNYEPREFISLFERAGFKYLRGDRWQSQELYHFIRREADEGFASAPRASETIGIDFPRPQELRPFNPSGSP